VIGSLPVILCVLISQFADFSSGFATLIRKQLYRTTEKTNYELLNHSMVCGFAGKA